MNRENNHIEYDRMTGKVYKESGELFIEFNSEW